MSPDTSWPLEVNIIRLWSPKAYCSIAERRDSYGHMSGPNA